MVAGRANAGTLAEIVGRYLVFLLLFVSWHIVKRIAFQLISQREQADKAGEKRNEKLKLLGLITSALLTMLFLQLMRLRVGYAEFVGILVILGLGGLRESLLKKGLLDWAQLVSLFYLTGIGYISICLIHGAVVWQPVFIALGLACLVLSFEILDVIEQNPERYPFQRNGTPTSKGAKLARCVPFLLACGPTFVASMAYMNELPKSFGAVFLTLLLSSRVITSLKDAEKSGTSPPVLSKQVAGICVLFVVIIAVTRYLTI